jgi:O-acetylserine/cysteine efflux transporter
MLASLLLEHGQLASLTAANNLGWMTLAYTVVFGGVVGFGLWFWLLARCSIARVAPFGLLQPVLAAACSVLFLGERLTTALAVGGLITLVGVAITQLKSKAKQNDAHSQAIAAPNHLTYSARPAF